MSNPLEKMKSLGLIGCIEDSEITSENYKEYLHGKKKNSEWTSVKEKLPTHDTEILFIVKEGKCSERIGIALNGEGFQHIILSHTDLDYDDILYWMEIPKDPSPPPNCS